MALHAEKIEKGSMRFYLGKPKAGSHKWMKKMMNRLIRYEAKKIDEYSMKPKRKYSGWEL